MKAKVVMLYTLNLYGTACQLYVSKTGRKEQELLCKTVNVWSSFYGKKGSKLLQPCSYLTETFSLRSNKKRKSIFKIFCILTVSSSRSVLLEFSFTINQRQDFKTI